MVWPLVCGKLLPDPVHGRDSGHWVFRSRGRSKTKTDAPDSGCSGLEAAERSAAAGLHREEFLM